ncbi:ATP-grasp domain-containing protein [Candidatus Woesearchaeota archaeon]|nr:ATP-grasp domain-containing protein [Candidatus Woesearchaeota archaeon]
MKLVMAYEHEWGKAPSWPTIKEYGLENINKAYFKLARQAAKKGFKFYTSAFEWFKKGRFTKGWAIEGRGYKQAFDIKPDVIFDKTKLVPKYIKFKKYFSKKGIMLNPYYIEDLCSDKFKTFRLFPRLTPGLFLVKNKKELKNKIKKIKTKLVVLKPRKGSSAHGLWICSKKEALKKNIKGDYVLQEFIDTRKGIKGLVKGVYDIRVIMAGGKFTYAWIRVAKKGFVSNISRGGKLVLLRNEQIPRKILKAARQIDNKLKNYNPRIYTADFILDENGDARLIELNSKPGFFFYKEKVVNAMFNAMKEAVK